MRLNRLLEKAIILATTNHSSQLDRAGQPYILHPLYVMNNVKSLKSKIVAVLHDIIEDTEITANDLLYEDFDKDIVEAIDILTKKKGQDYNDYIDLIAKNDLAREVKIEDLKHNMDLSRLNKVTQRDQVRYEKYKVSLNYLINIK